MESRKWEPKERVAFWIKIAAVAGSVAAGMSAGGLSYAELLGLQSSSAAKAEYEQINDKLDRLGERIDQLFARECNR
jgi:hypothetical protein